MGMGMGMAFLGRGMGMLVPGVQTVDGLIVHLVLL